MLCCPFEYVKSLIETVVWDNRSNKKMTFFYWALLTCGNLKFCAFFFKAGN